MGEFGNKGSVEIAEAEKASDIFYSEWHGPLGDTLYFRWVHLYLSLPNDDPEVFDFSLVKLTFLRFQKEVVLCKFVKEVVDFFAVFFGVVSRSNYGIVHIDMEPSLGDFIQEDFVHYCLEGRRRVC